MKEEGKKETVWIDRIPPSRCQTVKKKKEKKISAGVFCYADGIPQSCAPPLHGKKKEKKFVSSYGVLLRVTYIYIETAQQLCYARRYIDWYCN